MALRAVQFVVDTTAGKAALGKPSMVELKTESSRAFTSGVSAQRPVLYVVRNRDVDSLLSMTDALVYVGNKNKSKELAALFGDHKRIQVGRTGYTTAGRLIQGVGAFLLGVHRNGERNAYVAGVDDKVFEQLVGKVNGKAGVARRRRMAPSSSPAPTPYLSPQQILDGIPKRPVPENLRTQIYIGSGPQVELVRQQILRAGEVDAPVLIIGPTGTGKENVARATHYFGVRASRPFLAVNSAAISPTVFESELFGHIKGSFTDAVANKAGLWEAAADGTLFLDEIGDLSLDLQSKILRALDRNEILRVGSVEPIAVRARVIAATNRNLFAMVRERQFREDLYYRLRHIMIQTPALAEHLEDIDELAQHVWRTITKKGAAVLPPDIIARLEAWRWPGNVRELQSVLRQLFLYFGDASPRVQDLDLVFALEGQRPQLPDDDGKPTDVTVHRAECLRQLRRADEVMRACQVTLEPVLKTKANHQDVLARVHGELHYRLQELQLLCLHPVLFHSDLTFEVINGLRGKLEYFHDLLERRPTDALRYYNREVRQQFKVALAAIFAEVERVVEG